MTQEEKFKNLCDLTTNLVGLPKTLFDITDRASDKDKTSLSVRIRTLDYQVPRMACAMVGILEDNIHKTIVAKVLQRDRTNINHYTVRHGVNYASFPLYRDTFNAIYNSYTQLKDAKLKFSDLSHLKRHLKDNGVFNSKKPQTIIRIKCGKVGTDVKVSYRDFYSTLELCKLALQDYQYEREIIQI